MSLPRLPLFPLLSLSLLLATLTMGCAITLGPPFQTLPAGMQSPTLEASMVEATQKYAAVEKILVKYTKVKIQDADWNTLRNESTGIILKRSVYAWAYATEPDGRCSYQRLVYQQEYDGHNFSPLLHVYQDGSPEGWKKYCTCTE